MTLKTFLETPHQNILITYFTQKSKDLKNEKRSDVHLSMFTDEGIKEYQGILNLSIESIDTENNIVYLKSDDFNNFYWENKVKMFWSSLTQFGAYRWNFNDYSDMGTTYDWNAYVKHNYVFTFTKEVVNYKISEEAS